MHVASAIEQIKSRYRALGPVMDERMRRLLTVSHFRRNPAAMKFVGGTQAECDFSF